MTKIGLLDVAEDDEVAPSTAVEVSRNEVYNKHILILTVMIFNKSISIICREVTSTNLISSV